MPGEGHGWIAHTGLSMAATITLVRDVSEEQVTEAFGRGREAVVRRDMPGPGAGHEAYLEDDDRAGGFLWITTVDEWWLIAEDNDYWGTLDETIAALGASRQVTVMWNVNLLTQVAAERAVRLWD